MMAGVGFSKEKDHFESGKNAAAEAMSRGRIQISSGYSLNSHVEGILDGGCDGFLQKPYNLTELSRKIQEVLLPAGDAN
jgi:hypothetical protein